MVILDRDGVINHDSADYVKSAAEWIPLPGSIEAIARLSGAGIDVYVATNQSGIGRGYFDQAELDSMHEKMLRLVRAAGGDIAGIFYCPHRPEDHCNCRKPLPGLLDQIIARRHLKDLARVPLVGDSLRDLQSGLPRGCQPILVRTGKGRGAETKLPDHPELKHTRVFDDLSAFVDQFLEPRV